MAVSAAAAAAYPTSHYSSFSASEAVRRATPTGTGSSSVDTKPGLSLWQNDYHKYSQAAAAQASAAASASTTSPTSTSAASGTSGSGTQGSCLTPTAAATAASMDAAAGFAAHQTAAAWNYPHPGQYAASALASTPEQAAVEAARARQMADTAAGFHADYTRLQYPPDGIYTHPPGMYGLICFHWL